MRFFVKKYILSLTLIIYAQVYILHSEEKEKNKQTEDRTDVALSYSMSGDSSGVNYVGLDVLRIVNLKGNHNLLVDMGFDLGISDAKDNYLFYIAPGYRLDIHKSENNSMFVDLITGSSLVSTPNSDKLDMGIFSSFGFGFRYNPVSISAKAVFINSKAYSDQFIKVGFAYSF
jgi:hypothetical protein